MYIERLLGWYRDMFSIILGYSASDGHQLVLIWEGIIWFQPLLGEKSIDLHPKNYFVTSVLLVVAVTMRLSIQSNREAICGLCGSFGGGIKDAVWCPAAVILTACGFSSSCCLHHCSRAACFERLVSTEAENKMLWINIIQIYNCRMLWYECMYKQKQNQIWMLPLFQTYRPAFV